MIKGTFDQKNQVLKKVPPMKSQNPAAHQGRRLLHRWEGLKAFVMGAIILPLSSIQATAEGMVSGKMSGITSEAVTVYQLEEITVTAPRTERRALQPATIISKDHARAQSALNVADLVYHSPSVGVRVNSRGETVLRIRGSEERQTAIFLDGAPLVVPWDGRVDLSLLPSHAVASTELVKSVAPVEYGAGAILGALDMASPLYQNIQPENTGLKGQAALQVASGGQENYTASMRYQGAERLFFATVADYHQQGIPLPNRQQAVDYIPETVNQKSLIPNTARSHQSLFTGVRQQLSSGWIGLSLLHIDGDKQIAAAGHLNPDVDTVRYWRYPKWQMTQLTGNAALSLWADTMLRTVVWSQNFNQTIHRFNTDAYAQVTDRQYDDDQTWGGRIILEHKRPKADFRMIASLQTSRHRQLDQSREVGGDFPDGGDSSLFRQTTGSLALEMDVPLGHKLKSSWAVGYDFSKTPLTGGRPRQKNLGAAVASGAVAYQAHSNVSLTLTAGQRTRFPTMRELYGMAIGQFILNPDLKPEKARLIDLSLQWQRQKGQPLFSLTPWYSDVKNSLSLRRVIVNGHAFRQRYNLRGIKGYGVDFTAQIPVTEQFEITADFTAQHLRAGRGASGVRQPIIQRPSTRVFLSAHYKPSEQLSLRADVDYQSGGLDEDALGRAVHLPHSTLINLNASYTLSGTRFTPVTIGVSVQNLGNVLRLPQLGLPDAGRQISVTIKSVF